MAGIGTLNDRLNIWWDKD